MGKGKLSDQIQVSVTYKNRNQDTVCEKTYGFDDYTSQLCLDIKRIIMDVEDLIYRLQDGRQKGEWDEIAIIGFNRIRHKLLDRAGDVERLKNCMSMVGSTPQTEQPDDPVDHSGTVSLISKLFAE